MLTPDWTFFPQLVLFLAAVVTLNLLLFRPIGRALAERSEGTSDVSSEADDLRAEAARLEADYEGKIRAAREHALASRTELRMAGQAEASKKVAQGRLEAEQIVAKMAQELGGEFEKARGELLAQAEGVSEAMVSRFMGRQS